MRYIDAEQITLIDKQGKTFELIDFPEIGELAGTEFELGVTKDLDSIAFQVYGFEALWYRIFDANIARILEAKYDMSQIKRLVIPE